MKKETVEKICQGYILGTGMSDTITKMLQDIYEYCLAFEDYVIEDDYESYRNRSECAYYVADIVAQTLSKSIKENIWKIL